ncbi:MAG: cation transporting ATPase C-terminal domain-containing protein, partial [Clostridia bacterium]|nr:cation transporting ATPase C-terminal domain-containing protein [Clostridia bacterium]
CSQTAHAYNMRSEKSLFKIKAFANKTLNLVTVISVVLIAFVLFVPGVNAVFGMTYLPYYCYLIGLGFTFVPVLLMEAAKRMGLIKNKN